ncbi:MAG TPA: MBL fold metallo-hydrolase [Nocardiopsis listeri]|uniref:MBL fold metallo-hydrolase n=1 Tax=Nocardiopsis listeri TaxID=53440 RepID=UPI001DD49E97|nr:MBL fold metallo-hydrolase [Nocardiopsis listeri]HJE58816.1 MBL fold metallo-hydrolase [Nocardiopsis listeri]
MTAHPGPSERGARGGLLRPSLSPWVELREPAADHAPGRLRAVFLGVSTILLTDGETAVLTDGFFSRPSKLDLAFKRLAPNRARVEAALARFGLSRLDAVFVVHSHFDHALDAPLVAELTGARLIGSESTHNIAAGQGLERDRCDPVVLGEPMRFGSLTLTALPAEHSPGDIAPGVIGRPLRSGRAGDFKTGDCYSLHVAHPDGELLIHASANWLPGALDGHRADTVYLGVGALGKQDERFRSDYWHHVVERTGARRVVPIHWDDFTISLNHPPRPLPRLVDDLGSSLDFLSGRARDEGVDLALPVLGRRTDPFRT